MGPQKGQVTKGVAQPSTDFGGWGEGTVWGKNDEGLEYGERVEDTPGKELAVAKLGSKEFWV